MMISQLAQSIAPSPTMAMTEQARLLREKGEPVIHLGLGEPKSAVPIEAIRSAAAQLSTGEVRYTPTDGIPELKKAIIRYTETNYQKTVTPDQVIVSAGAKQSLATLLTTIINPQDEVVILAPYWVSYPEMVKIACGRPVIVKVSGGSFYPTLADIEKATTPSTKAIILNSPNNPSGAVYSESFIADVVDFCEKKHIHLISDDIYHQLTFNGDTARRIYQYTKKDIENSYLVIINGVSKPYAMTGFRIGWTIGPRAVITAMTNVQGQTSSCPPVISQIASVGALTGMQNGVNSLRMMLQNHGQIMVDALKTFSKIKISPPQGTFYCFPDFSAYNPNSVELADFLLKKAMVVTVPGKEFGMEGHLRLSYCGTIQQITEGVARIKWALDPESSKEIFIGDRRMVRDWQ